MTTVLVPAGADPRCPCGRRQTRLRVLAPADTVIALPLRCPRCHQHVEYIVRLAARRRIVHRATG